MLAPVVPPVGEGSRSSVQLRMKPTLRRRRATCLETTLSGKTPVILRFD
jgi:hypothetical protein